MQAPASPGAATEAPSLLGVLNQCAEWRGRYKLRRHTNTWYKLKWHMELRLTFRLGGELTVVARWPKFPQPSTCQHAKWRLEAGGGGVVVEFELELPGGRREGGRTRDCEAFHWRGRLVQSRGAPHLEGTAAGSISDLRYEWYAVPPEPLSLLRAAELDLFGKLDESLPRPFSVLSFKTGFIEQKAEHFTSTLGLPSSFSKADSTARDLAVAAVGHVSRYHYINGPREIARHARQSQEESGGMRDSFLEGDAGSGVHSSLEEHWCSIGEALVPVAPAAAPTLGGSGSSSSSVGQEAVAALEREERQLRHALLMRLLQVMLASRPADAAIAECFCGPSAQEAFFRRAVRLPDAESVLLRCGDDFKASTEVVRSALTVAVEGLLTPFMAGGISTLTVESDHDYHPNEDWAFALSIPGATRLKLKFDSRTKTESGRDYLQFFAERDTQGNFSRRLHGEDKLSGQYPSGFPDLHVNSDRAWVRFHSDGSEQFWGFRFTLTGEGGGASTAAVPFPAALQLLVATTKALPQEDQLGARLMSASVLLSVAAAQPLSDEATQAAEALCELLPEPCQWSDCSWRAALSLMSVAERNGRRQLLASLVTLLSTQMGPRALAGSGAPPALLLDRVVPVGSGLLLNGRMTLVADGTERASALGLPVPLLARAGHALFCVRVEPLSASAGAGVGVALAPSAGEREVADAEGGTDGSGSDACEARAALQAAVFCDVTSIALPGEELSVEVQRHAGGSERLQLVVMGLHGAVKSELPSSWCDAAALLPALWVQGFGAALTLQPPPVASRDSEAAAGRLEQLRLTSRLVEACRGSRASPLPAALVAGAWARRKGCEDVDAAAVQERLRSRCTAAVESEHPHAWGLATQRLEVPGASAIELSFPRVELAEGYRLRVTHDAAGELPVMKTYKPADVGGVRHSVESQKFSYATLDDLEPDSQERGHQEGWMRAPQGWELATATPELIDGVVARHTWGTDLLVLANGDAFYTLGFEHGNKAGQSAGRDKLSSRTADACMEYQPQGPGRVLICRARPSTATPRHSQPLVSEDLAPGERVVVPGSAVYIHGPLPQPPRWDVSAREDSASDAGDSEVGAKRADAAAGGAMANRSAGDNKEEAQQPRPLLCPGPWAWMLAPGRRLPLLLAPDGEISMAGAMAGDKVGAGLPKAYARADAAEKAVCADDFRITRVSGSWDTGTRCSLHVDVDGCDDCGPVHVTFRSNCRPCLEDGIVAVHGEVSRRQASGPQEANVALGVVIADWRWPQTFEAAVEVQVLGRADPPTALGIRVLGATQTLAAAVSSSETDAHGIAAVAAEADVRSSLVLAQGEHVVQVCGICAPDRSLARLEVRTSRGRRVAWPPFPIAGEPFECTAPEFCEISGLTWGDVAAPGASTAAASSASVLWHRPLALVQTQAVEPVFLPEGTWEGYLQRQGGPPQQVHCRLTAASAQRSFSALLDIVSVAGKRCGSLERGEITAAGFANAVLADEASGPAVALEGRCVVHGDRHAALLLVGEAPTKEEEQAAAATSKSSNMPSTSAGVRLALRYKAKVANESKQAIMLDGPSLVYHALSSSPKYLMHTARTPWTHQIAIDCMVAELLVQRLGSRMDGAGLVVAVAEDTAGGGLEPLTAWPGRSHDRWLWRSDGTVAHLAVGEQRSILWCFGAGDRVGFAVEPAHVNFLRNGERVHTVPRFAEGGGQSLRGLLPVLVVGLGCDAVLRLCEGAQHVYLWEDLGLRFCPATAAPSRSSLVQTPRQRLRRALIAVVWLCRLIKRTFTGPASWGSLPIASLSLGSADGAADFDSHGSAGRPGDDAPPSSGPTGEALEDVSGLRNQDLAPVFSRAVVKPLSQEELDVAGDADALAAAGEALADECPDEALPAGMEPYTVEARIRVSTGDGGREMCVLAWGDERHPHDRGLAVHGFAASAACALKGAKKICDGLWHHVACTFDGRERRLWTDFELVARDVPGGSAVLETVEERESAGQSGLRLGSYPPGHTELRGTRGCFRGDLRDVRIWRVILSPAAMRANAASREAQMRKQVTVEAAQVLFSGVDQQGQGQPGRQDFDVMLGGTGGAMFRHLDPAARGFSCREDWLGFCGELRTSRGDAYLMRFMQACARNLGQRRGPLAQAGDELLHAAELQSELALASSSYGWRVEAKPVNLNDRMLESIEGDGVEQFRQQMRVSHALLGQSADEAVVELADRVALQQGNHDDCWTKMIGVAEWSLAQPRWLEQAVGHTKLGDMSTQAKLQEVLAWHSASCKVLSDSAQQALLSAIASARLEDMRKEADQAGGASEDFAPLAAKLLAEESEPMKVIVGNAFQEAVGSMLFFRFLILLELNRSVSRDFLPLIDLTAPAASAYGRLLLQVKPLLLGHLKFSRFQHVLQSTKYEGSTPSILLNRKVAATLRERGRVDWEFRKSLIGQLMAEFRKQSSGPKLFRRPWQARCCKVQFKGEGGEDAGGLYREALDAVAQELHSKAVPLFVPCPNAIAEVGDNRDAWILNPRATTPECIRALAFVGQLMGLALRTGDLLPLNLAAFTWKGVVGDERKREDIRSVDIFADKHLAILGGEKQPDEDAIAAMGALQFVYPDVTGEEVELIEGGVDVSVTADNASEFARLLLHNRLNFDQLQLQALRRGLATVVPIRFIRLWAWRDLQERVCGVAEVDLELLQRHTAYKNCTNASRHVGYMWEALANFTQKQRRSFLRFVWGRSSLPTVEKWERSFTVQLLNGTDDTRLPCSHTCFFTLDLPTYSSAEVCRAKLAYCIENCMAIDADGAAARALNWDEDDED